ncbi:hypothetical protein Poli38472_003567 [Pythium oligandrum]|uniref:Uncharacterized protein n=1 Tax=Pythium oligandrum TaxID=41045 RepID=A0A8K1CNS4_PYTOL|nr:hypothetical protein Poli38472_003567 [Pythium oligandrum]|eukprot:TMW65802.1 hypothetical protein Poli38472_003567 [Pythium oligandrum]
MFVVRWFWFSASQLKNIQEAMKLNAMFYAGFALAGAVQALPASRPEVKRFTAFTRPLELEQGEVTNTFHRLEIPKGPIAVYRFEADVVEKGDDGKPIPTPIFDAYLHHHVVGSNHKAYAKESGKWAPMKPVNFSRSVGFGAGTESRGTPQEFYYPYAFVTVEGEDEWFANVHVINTRKMTPANAHKCLECPCTSEDVFTKTSVNGRKFFPDSCNAELRHENNTVCAAATYHGGLRCCEEAAFCLEKEDLTETPKSTYYLRYTIEYSEVTPENRPLYLAGCCDASGDFTNHGNIEYDIPPCDPIVHPGCVHTLSTRQYLDKDISTPYNFLQGNGDLSDREVDVVFAVGHQHRGGMGISLYNDATGELICNSVPHYGSGDVVGNEKDYVVAMTTCTFDPPLRMRASDVVRVVSLYNNTMPHTGAMSLMYLAISDVGTTSVALMASVKSDGSSIKLITGSTVFVIGGVVAALVVIVGVTKHLKKRRGYSPLLSTN